VTAIIQRRRRSALESFDGCPHRFNVLYNLCLCGHPRSDHGPAQADAQGTECVHRSADDPVHGIVGTVCGCESFRAVEDRGDESQRGIAFHECTFRYIARLAEAGMESDAGEASLAFQEGIALSQLPFHLVDHVARLWRPFVEWFQLDLDAYMEAEERQELMVCSGCRWTGQADAVTWTGDGTPDDPQTPRCPKCGHVVRGFTWIPDLVYVRPQGVEIKDWKTYYKGLTYEQALKEFQLKFYLLRAMDIWPGFPSYTFTFNFVRLGYEVPVTLTPDRIEAFRDEVESIMLSMDEAERTANYPAIPGSHCTLCRLNCPLVDNPHRMPIRLTNIEQAQATFGELLVLEQRLKTLRKSLDGWCQQEGPLVYRGQEYRHNEIIKRSYPAATVLDALTALGADVSGVTLSKSGLGDLAKPKKSSVAVQNILAKHEQTKISWQFRHRKAGESKPAGKRDVLGDVDPDAGGDDEGGDDGGE
jgi:hypothetical protein